VQFIRAVNSHDSPSPVYDLIKRPGEDGLADLEERWAGVYGQLGCLALSVDIDAGDKTLRGKQPQYLRWVATGRKGGICPFGH